MVSKRLAIEYVVSPRWTLYVVVADDGVGASDRVGVADGAAVSVASVSTRGLGAALGLGGAVTAGDAEPVGDAEGSTAGLVQAERMSALSSSARGSRAPVRRERELVRVIAEVGGGHRWQ